MATHSVALVTAEEPGIFTQAIRAKVPLPDEPVTAVRLVRAGQVMATRIVSQPATEAALSVWETAEFTTLSWGLPDTPALVRYSADGGETWTVLGLDVLGGQLTIETAQLSGENGRFEVLLADSNIRFTVGQP